MLNISSPKLFSLTPIIHFKPERGTCPDCHIKLKVQKTLPDKKIATLAVGDLIAHETVYHCEKCGHIFHSRELRSLIPEKCNFGFDVIVFIGKSLFLRCRNYQEILSELKQKNVTISVSEIGVLAKKFVVYLALLHKLVQRKTRRYMNMNGGYILHLDGTCEGGSPHLISVLDGISEIVLGNAKLPSENSDDLIPFLEGIKKAYGVPLAVVSDMGNGIALAIKKVFKNVAAFICHYHFLKALGKDLFGDENDIIRKRLQKHGIQAVLKRRARQLEESITDTTNLVDGFVTGIESEKIPSNCPLGHVSEIAAYTLIKWALDGKRQGNGFGFPFDQRYLSFYQRLTELNYRLHQLIEIKLQGDWKENRIYGKICHDLLKVINDPALKNAAVKMEEKVIVFNELRKAMRITLPENKRGLNDNGGLSNIKTIEKEVKKYRDRLCTDKKYSGNKDYQKIVEQINKYWTKLFADPIIVETKAGRIVIQPQRTNNILEQFFRKLMRIFRKRNGFNAMEKTIKTMLSDTPFVVNLENKDYMNILLDGKETLEERFVEIDAKRVRKELEKSRSEESVISPKIKKIIRMPELPKSIVVLLDRKASCY